ncbi:MAG TPA: helix-turn-helix domain-containing protein [Acidimicrobiales bacterium]|nr:helix-turn-helix domain-containing protein [Acidimicrobiales bacterium]
MDANDIGRRIAGIAALDQPLRRALYRLLAAADGWTTRDEAAAALDVPRSVAAFHLDKLADAGVAEVGFERTTGRTGPGAGRPSKLYRLAGDEVSASVPERHYELAGSLLATAVAESTRTGTPVAVCLRTTARAAGRQVGDEASGTTVVDALARQGYEPEARPCDEIALANCPFHRLAEQHRDLVCGMNVDFVDGLLDGLGETGRLTARFEPAAGHCCVRIAPS